MINKLDFIKKETVLVVDDNPDNLMLVSGVLSGLYAVKGASNGESALKIALLDAPPDLIVLDIMLPDIDGYEICKRLKTYSKTRSIPVIFLSGKTDMESELRGFQLGAVDYITKPINPFVLLARIKTILTLKSEQDFLRDQNVFLEAEITRRTNEVQATQDLTIYMMASLAEWRDNETGNHICRTQRYVKLLAERLRLNPQYSDVLNKDDNIELIFKSAPLHDIGKVGIPDRILLKHGFFEPEELDIMKTHTTIGRALIIKAERDFGIAIPLFKFAEEIVSSHHEKWDGSGYPEGLVGNDIPVSARLMSLADVYDALISNKVYKRGLSHEDAVKTILDEKGRHFDPGVVHAFQELQFEFQSIAKRYPDSSSDIEKQVEYLEEAMSEKISYT